jgi:hypothetical protein
MGWTAQMIDRAVSARALDLACGAVGDELGGAVLR